MPAKVLESLKFSWKVFCLNSWNFCLVLLSINFCFIAMVFRRVWQRSKDSMKFNFYSSVTNRLDLWEFKKQSSVNRYEQSKTNLQKISSKTWSIIHKLCFSHQEQTWLLIGERKKNNLPVVVQYLDFVLWTSTESRYCNWERNLCQSWKSYLIFFCVRIKFYLNYWTKIFKYFTRTRNIRKKPELFRKEVEFFYLFE